MEKQINIEDYLENKNIKIDHIIYQKMNLIYNALEEGWSIKKKDNSYIFTKKHENKKEIFEDAYLLKFLKTNFDINKLLN
jgi:hypothetical protein